MFSLRFTFKMLLWYWAVCLILEDKFTEHTNKQASKQTNKQSLWRHSWSDALLTGLKCVDLYWKVLKKSQFWSVLMSLKQQVMFACCGCLRSEVKPQLKWSQCKKFWKPSCRFLCVNVLLLVMKSQLTANTDEWSSNRTYSLATTSVRHVLYKVTPELR